MVSILVAFHVSYSRGVGRLEGSQWFLFRGGALIPASEKDTKIAKLLPGSQLPLMSSTCFFLRGGKGFGKLEILHWFHEGVVSMYVL